MMNKLTYGLFCLLLVAVFGANQIAAQDNVGIGTATPHPSALLQITDSARGVLIPRTDTQAVYDHLSALPGAPGVEDGMLIYDLNLNTYMFYDDVMGYWRPLVGLIGPTGPKGPRGPTGATGKTGISTKWRDSTNAPPAPLADDTCGDWFIDVTSGKVWKLWCDTPGGPLPMLWKDTVSYENFIGELVPPDEKIFAVTLHASGALIETMANQTQGVVLKQIPGLVNTLTIDRDEVAYVWAAAHGNTQKAFADDNFAYAQYDIEFNQGFPAYFYSGKFPLGLAHAVTVGPNSTKANQNADIVGWYVSGNAELVGPISPFPCGPCGPFPACTLCTPLNSTLNITVFAGNRFASQGAGSILILGDEVTKENPAHLSIFAIIRRSPTTWPWKR